MDLAAGQLISHYRVAGRIGSGGMGVVYKARDESLGRLVALKVLQSKLLGDEHWRLRFLREARLAAAINHPNVATIHEVAEADGIVFIVMELIEGESLRERLQAGPIPIETALSIASQIADGLAKAHQAGIVHRDLKPENVLVGPDGASKILDFGLARLHEGAAHSGPGAPVDSTTPTIVSAAPEQATREGWILGTTPYMSPEQAAGRTVDSRSDVFSFGSLLYELVTGRQPFSGETNIDTLRAILREPAPSASALNPNAPAALEPILSKCLEKDPSRRYQDTRDLSLDMRRLSREVESGVFSSYKDRALSSSASAGPAAALSRPRVRRFFGPAAIGITLVLAALGFGAWFLRNGRSGPGGIGSGTPGAALDDRTILVLPFVVHGQESEGAYVGEAFAEAIAVDLAESHDLKILPVPVALTDPGGSVDPVALATAAGAGRVLSGTLTRIDSSLTASVSLIDSSANRILWGAVKDTSLTDLTGLAGQFARDAIGQMGAGIAAQWDYPLYLSGNKRISTSPEAFETLTAWKAADFARGYRASERLLEAFPDDPGALALYLFISDQSNSRYAPDRAVKFAEVSATLDRIAPGNPYTQYFRTLGVSSRGLHPADELLPLLTRNDLRAGCKAWFLRMYANRSVRGTPVSNYVTSFTGRQDEGEARRLEAAGAKLQESIRLDPASAWGHLYLGWILHRLGRSDEALAETRNAVSIEPSYPICYSSLGSILLSLGRFPEAVDAFRQTVSVEDSETSDVAAFAFALAKAGRDAEAQAQARTVSELPESPLADWFLARYEALEKQPGRSLHLLEAASARGLNVQIALDAPEFSILRDDPETAARFDAVAKAVRARDQAANAG